jgi:hypothetical protein
MGVRSMTVRRFEEIRRRLGEGRGLREIARALGCSRDSAIWRVACARAAAQINGSYTSIAAVFREVRLLPYFQRANGTSASNPAASAVKPMSRMRGQLGTYNSSSTVLLGA